MEEDSSTHPLVIQMINEVADLISASDFREFYESHKSSAKWIPYTLTSYLFIIFSIFIKAAKKPHTIRRYKIEITVKYEDVDLLYSPIDTTLLYLSINRYIIDR